MYEKLLFQIIIVFLIFKLKTRILERLKIKKFLTLINIYTINLSHYLPWPITYSKIEPSRTFSLIYSSLFIIIHDQSKSEHTQINHYHKKKI